MSMYVILNTLMYHAFLTMKFELHFLENVSSRLLTIKLLGLKQGEEETFTDFVGRFTNEIKDIEDAHPSLVIQAFMIGLKPSRIFLLLVERPPMMILESISKNLLIGDTLGSSSEGTKNLHPDLKDQRRDRLTLSLVDLSREGTIPRLPRTRDGPEKEMEYLNLNHDGALVIFVRMINNQVKRAISSDGN
ncbi:hypothetical protein C4D60_Mb01t24460 [Musa balbisiana]|uniref:Retrotransposon gag domain-containing protein n=1 Tax=Musa balbisiana TaxID=52838 RepID=A0A4S8JPJ3_MUSBA|nr:hypothetical protein C4D60_Mb01t24460 [Musa balbisiana]